LRDAADWLPDSPSERLDAAEKLILKLIDRCFQSSIVLPAFSMDERHRTERAIFFHRRDNRKNQNP
jgi:hypothetical protein